MSEAAPMKPPLHFLSTFFAGMLTFAGCYDEAVPPSPQPVATVLVHVGTTTTTTRQPPIAGTTLPAEVERVHVYTDKNIDRPTEVVGALDFHTDADSQDKGFGLLKERAAALGADAVIGAEFEHGDGNAPSHLSGLAVRFTDR